MTVKSLLGSRCLQLGGVGVVKLTDTAVNVLPTSRLRAEYSSWAMIQGFSSSIVSRAAFSKSKQQSLSDFSLQTTAAPETSIAQMGQLLAEHEAL